MSTENFQATIERHCIAFTTLIYLHLTIIFPHKSLCQNANVCYFNFNNIHTYCRDISTLLRLAADIIIVAAIVVARSFCAPFSLANGMAATLTHSKTECNNTE